MQYKHKCQCGVVVSEGGVLKGGHVFKSHRSYSCENFHDLDV